MDVALADLFHSDLLPLLFIEDMKLKNVIEISRRLPEDFVPQIVIMLVDTYSHPSMTLTGIRKLKCGYWMKKLWCYFVWVWVYNQDCSNDQLYWCRSAQ